MNLKNLGLIGIGVVAGIAGSMQFEAIAQRSAGPVPYEELHQLTEVFGLIKSDYVEQVDDKKLLTEAISGMVASLDPHSAYLDEKAYRELTETTQGKFVGLGIEVGMEDGNVKVISPIEDSPAYKAGVKAGDLITRLDGVSIKGLSLDDAVKRMRGEVDSKIVLTVFRKDEDKPIQITIVRKEIRVQSVKGKVVEPGYAWIRVSQFQEPTVEDLCKKITAIYAQEPHLKGLVLDLRNDPGGLLPSAIGVSAAFLPKDKLVVSTKGQLPEMNKTHYARDAYGGRNDPLQKLPEGVKNVPIVVLVNVGTASASEIVAGALQDYKRATIIGTQTFGKGSVQSIQHLTANTAIKLTTARYYTPNDRSIQAKGIVPDLLVDEYADGDGLNSLRIHEADLQKHLSNDKDKDSSADKAKSKVDEFEEEMRLAAQEKKRKPVEYGSKDDFQLAQALNFLKDKKVQTAKPKTDVAAVQDGAATGLNAPK